MSSPAEEGIEVVVLLLPLVCLLETSIFMMLLLWMVIVAAIPALVLVVVMLLTPEAWLLANHPLLLVVVDAPLVIIVVEEVPVVVVVLALVMGGAVMMVMVKLLLLLSSASLPSLVVMVVVFVMAYLVRLSRKARRDQSEVNGAFWAGTRQNDGVESKASVTVLKERDPLICMRTTPQKAGRTVTCATNKSVLKRLDGGNTHLQHAVHSTTMLARGGAADNTTAPCTERKRVSKESIAALALEGNKVGK